MKRFLPVMLACLLAVQACDRQPAAGVVVYVPADFEARAVEWLPGSGLDVTIVAGDSADLTTMVIDKRDSPRADVLITSGVVDIWRAGDEGALRPLDDEAAARIPVGLKDPDLAWAALSATPLLIVHTAAMPELPLASYADLGEPEFAGRLCVTTSALPANRALLGMLIEDLGVKPAERVVRRWVRNLAAPPFATEDELVTALASGACEAAIVSAASGPGSLTRIVPEPVYYDIRGIGVARHAGNPEAGRRLVSWVLAEVPLPESVDAGNRNIAAAGFHGEEARLLAERAAYR